MRKETESSVDEIQTKKVYFLVIEYIKTLIKNDDIAFGSKLPSERQLMETLGLGRNSIREALRSLENMGIIESHHGQGNYLKNHMDKSLYSMLSLLLLIDECNYKEICQLRRIIEIGAYLLSIKQAKDSELMELFHSLHNLKNCNLKERTIYDKNFHDTLIDISGNRLLQLLNRTLAQLFENSIHKILDQITPEEWQELLAYHEQIWECLTKRDESGGIRAIMRHYDMLDIED
ncbi:MAG: FadR family transcriptional regulator [Lachnospiraceae bacterium]|jgi:GntR family transcriptional repressor for pyruvate dehydrogenase complex|nr:FadR family transcriptional regulator [Lachnospiraceae bacterium]